MGPPELNKKRVFVVAAALAPAVAPHLAHGLEGGAQLLVVSAKYSAPLYLLERLGKKEYRDVYLDLNGAAVANTKTFIQDNAADGLKAKNAGNQAADVFEVAGKQMIFDGEPKKQKMSDQDYQKAFADADEKYAQILTALLSQIKKSS